jgi:hypothetical protein
MNRVIAVTATLASAAMAGTMAAAATIPALAAPRPVAAHPARHAEKAAARSAFGAQPRAAAAPGPGFQPTTTGSELDGGKYVTVVHCQGVDSPPPVTLDKPGTPLTVNGTGPSAAILTMLKKPGPYKTIYTCTVTVEEKAPASPKPVAKVKKGCEIKSGGRARCTKPVTLNTGFGGEAQQVKDHHPAG